MRTWECPSLLRNSFATLGRPSFGHRCHTLYFLLALAFFVQHHSCDGEPVLRLFGSVPDTGSWAVGLAVRWGTDRAIADISEAALGFTVEVTWRDDECSRQGAIEHLVDAAMTMGDEPFHAVLGSGCSPACVGLAELSPLWSIPVMSWGCASPSLSDTTTYPYFTRTEQSGVVYSLGHLMMLRYMNWRSCGCVVSREDSLFFVNVQAALMSYLSSSDLGVDIVGTYYYESATNSADLQAIAGEIAEKGTRIVLLTGYEGEVTRSFCAFYSEGLVGSHWVFMSFAWFSTNWLTTSAASTKCSPTALLSAAVGMIGVTTGTWALDESMRTLMGDSPQDLKTEYYSYIENHTDLSGDDAVSMMYDAVWSLALAMQSHLTYNPSALTDTPGKSFLKNYTAEIIKQDFIGASGRVHFNTTGDRLGSVDIRQLDDAQKMILKGSCDWTSCFFVDSLDFGLSEPWDPAEPDVLDGRVPDSEALTCGDEYIVDIVANVCRACPVGKVLLQIDDVKSCACSAGSNISASNSSSCTSCPAGRYTSSVGAAGACTACEAGSYTELTGSTGCSRCPVGSWQSSEGASACNACPDSKSTQILGADSSEMCICPEGMIAVAAGSSTTCATCGVGMDCTAWNTSEPKSLPGYMLWYKGTGAAPGLPGVFECSSGSSRCPGGSFGSCAEGRHGLLCSECLEGLVPQGDGTCGACTAMGSLTAGTFITVIFVSLLLAYFWSNRRKGIGGEFLFFVVTFLSVMLTFCQTLAVLDMLAVEWGSPLNGILSVMRVFVFDVDITSFSCVASMSEVTAYSVWVLTLPLMTLFLLVLSGAHSTLTSKCQFKVWKAAAGGLNSLGFISYTALILSIFQCEGHPAGILTVRSRSSVICWTSDEHHHLLVVGCVFLLWPIAFLSTCAYAVYKLPQMLGQGNIDFLQTWEFLFGRFRNGCHWFCLLVFLRGLLLSLVSVFTNAAVQIVVMQVVLLAFHTVTCTQRPWRTRIMDLFDRNLISPTLIMTLVVAPFFVDDSTEFVAWLPFVALLCCIGASVVLLILQLGLLVKRRNQKPFHFFLCHHKVGAGSFARLLKMRLKSTRKIIGDVWLDSDNLTDMTLLLAYVQQAQYCVALCTEQLLMRPWCVGELTTAHASNTPTVLVKFPNFAHLERRSIDNFEAVVPEIHKLLAHGIDVAAVQSMLRWFPENEAFELEMPLHSHSVAQLAARLTTLHAERMFSMRSMATDREIQQVSTSVHSSRRSIIVDTSRTEALANAWIIATLLSESYATEPGKVPDVLLEDSRLQAHAKKVVVICSEKCFENPRVVDNLVTGAQLGVQSLPIITEEEFRFPSETFFQELEQRGIENCPHKVHIVIPIIRSIFQEIAIVVKPADYSTTEAILLVRASEIARRLDSTLSVLDFGATATASTSFPRSNFSNFEVIGSPTASTAVNTSTPRPPTQEAETKKNATADDEVGEKKLSQTNSKRSSFREDCFCLDGGLHCRL